MKPVASNQVRVARGPYFDELERGATFTAPATTLDDGIVAAHRAIVGGRFHLSLDGELAHRIAGRRLVPPGLVWDVSIGHSTVVTQQVRANLFYRGLHLHRLPSPGDTLATVTTVEALRETTRKPGREPTGLALLHILTEDQEGRRILDYRRCAMLPLSADSVTTGWDDDLQSAPTTSAAEPYAEWDLPNYRDHVGTSPFDGFRVDDVWEVTDGDVVSSAPELARLTGNVAAVHHDSRRGGGSRLVYGGHTIGLALHAVLRAIPGLVTVIGWESCDHLAPVLEGDLITSRIVVTGLHPVANGSGIVQFHVVSTAHSDGRDPRDVLDWRFSALAA